MAKPANDESIRRDEAGPDYKGAIGLIRGAIRSNQAETSSLGQENATLFTRIDKQYGVHRGAAKDFGKIDQMAPEKRVDYMRSLLGLLGHAGYDNFNDLVDRAQAPAGKAKAATKPKADPTPPKSAPGATDTADRDISLPDLDPVIEQQKQDDAAEFDGGNVHRLEPGKGGKAN